MFLYLIIALVIGLFFYIGFLIGYKLATKFINDQIAVDKKFILGNSVYIAHKYCDLEEKPGQLPDVLIDLPENKNNDGSFKC